MSYFTIALVILLFACYIFYVQQKFEMHPASERRQKMFELLNQQYEGLKENNLGYFEYSINNKNILFEYKTYRSKTVVNILKVYVDISNIEEDIRKLCKIHFYCVNIDNRDWVEMPVDVIFDTLNNLAKKSNKTVSKIISETEIYISEKRTERDKKKLFA
ncbi:hypothetical protein [Flavobacterium hibisci]|uniref:hypothetical protein n=1 Tax=Flavobacterium hibisci TaxID=1914462 RepID=UPI001CBFD67B|nr:hypothetical protein [Flavobacterium hibisci]MBZ4041267.1 hypothetical protein [Flavobacterium hibisci]